MAIGKHHPDFTRNDTTGEYHNKDVQTVYEAGVKDETMQATGRAGLVKNPSIVILRSSHDLPSVSHRDQTIHWDHVDWAAADNNLDTLREVIAQREAQEAAEAEAIASGDVQAVMEIKDVGKSQAYKDTKDTRPQRVANKKADRNAQVIALLGQWQGDLTPPSYLSQVETGVLHKRHLTQVKSHGFEGLCKTGGPKFHPSIY